MRFRTSQMLHRERGNKSKRSDSTEKCRSYDESRPGMALSMLRRVGKEPDGHEGKTQRHKISPQSHPSRKCSSNSRRGT